MLGPRASIVPEASQPPPEKESPAPGKARRAFGVYLGPVGYALARLGILLLHLVCAAYFGVAGLVYYVLPDTYLDNLLAYYSLTLDTKWFRAISTVHFIFAAVHGLVLLWAFLAATLVCWIQRRFKHRTASFVAAIKARRGSSFATSSRLSSVANLMASAKPTRVGKAMIFVYKRVLAQKGFFDVESHDFEMSLLGREVAETVLQAYQAYTMNRLLPRQQLNRFYVTMLVLNCWSTPLLHHVSGRNEPLKRLLVLLCDVVLDFVSVVGVPVWLALDYLADYDPTTRTFQFVLFYNETWMIGLLSDVPLILLGSWLDGISRLVFSLGMLSTIDDIKKLIKRKNGTHKVQTSRKTSPAPVTLTKTATKGSPTLPPRKRIVRWTHRGMVVFGFVILGFQIHAELKPTPPSCALEIRPWLISQPACALIEINCLSNRELSGNRADFDAIFTNLDPVSLLQIVVRHCPRLEMTPRIQNFHHIIGFKTYNVTIATWDVDSAFTDLQHPNLRFLFFVRTNFPDATLPEGLWTSTFTADFKQITVSGTNINRLPETTSGPAWPTAIAFHIEYGELTEYPLVINTIQPNELSLSYNQITHLPEEAFQLETLMAFTGNPITSLPDDVNTSTLASAIILMDRTQLAHPLPLWIDETYVGMTMLFFGDTPFCDEVALNDTSEEYAELLETRPWLVDGQVDCVYFDLFFYPVGVDVRTSEGATESLGQ